MSNSTRIPHTKTYHYGRSSQSCTNIYLIPHNDSYTMASRFMLLGLRSKLILKITRNAQIVCKTKPHNLMIQHAVHIRTLNIVTTLF